MLRIFIGWDSRFPEPADVLRYSLLKHSSIPLEIHYLKLNELDINRKHDPLASTEFTYSRFLVPHLCNFQGKALFLDNDMLCLGDVKEIADLDMSYYALRVVKHDYQPENTVKMYGAVADQLPTQELVEHDAHGLWQAPAVDQRHCRNPNRRLPPPLPGHLR